jgi:hypothetical protein
VGIVRRAHYLRPNRKVELPSHCIFVDVETHSVGISDTITECRLYFGYACYIRRTRNGRWTTPEYFRFEDNDQFWNWVESHTRPKVRLYVYAHNISFDFQVLRAFTSLASRGWRLEKIILDEPPTALTWRKGKATIIALDTLNYFRVSLAKLGESVGIPKLEMPPDNAPREQWDTYCRQDVAIICRAMQAYFDFIKINDLGNYAITISSQAFNAYRHRFMQAPIFIDNNQPALKLARDGYYGGRCEAFRIGRYTGQFYLLDINSMYPYVMAFNNYPTVLKGVLRNPDLSIIKGLLKDYMAIARVTLDTNIPAYPARVDGKLYFPIGKFETVLPDAELRYALSQGHIVSISEAAIYDCAPLFSGYVESLYDLRKKYSSEGNTAFAYLTKLMLNSLYGKFGQRGQNWEDIGECPDDEFGIEEAIVAKTGERVVTRKIGGKVQRLSHAPESYNSYPAIAACVTSAARMRLWMIIQFAWPGNCYYCDTDSIITNQAGYKRLRPLIDNDKLGMLKLEKQGTEIQIIGAKHYSFDGKVKIKGVSAKANHISDNEYEMEQFHSIKHGLRYGHFERMYIEKITKSVAGQYDKGQVQSDGTVRPFYCAGFAMEPERCYRCGKLAMAGSGVEVVRRGKPRHYGWVGGFWVEDTGKKYHSTIRQEFVCHECQPTC